MASCLCFPAAFQAASAKEIPSAKVRVAMRLSEMWQRSVRRTIEVTSTERSSGQKRNHQTNLKAAKPSVCSDQSNAWDVSTRATSAKSNAAERHKNKAAKSCVPGSSGSRRADRRSANEPSLRRRMIAPDDFETCPELPNTTSSRPDLTDPTLRFERKALEAAHVWDDLRRWHSGKRTLAKYSLPPSALAVPYSLS